LQRIFVLRRVLNPLSPVEAMELLITRLEKVRTTRIPAEHEPAVGMKRRAERASHTLCSTKNSRHP